MLTKSVTSLSKLRAKRPNPPLYPAKLSLVNCSWARSVLVYWTNMNTPNANRLPTFKKIPTQNVSTGKKAQAESNSQWKRKHLQSVGGDEKEQVIKKIRTSVTAGAKVGREIVVGFNSVMRLIERDEVAVVCVAQDGHPTLLKSMVEAAKAKQIATVTIPKLSQSARKELSLKSASCFAVRETVSSDPTSDGSEDASASIDDLKEYLLSL